MNTYAKNVAHFRPTPSSSTPHCSRFRFWELLSKKTELEILKPFKEVPDEADYKTLPNLWKNANTVGRFDESSAVYGEIISGVTGKEHVTQGSSGVAIGTGELLHLVLKKRKEDVHSL